MKVIESGICGYALWRGWACDSTQSHSKRAKPTYTDPEDDSNDGFIIANWIDVVRPRERWQLLEAT